MSIGIVNYLTAKLLFVPFFFEKADTKVPKGNKVKITSCKYANRRRTD